MAITDRMKCGVKPSAVRSENYLHNIKASNGPQFDVQMVKTSSLMYQLWVMGITVTFPLLTSE